MKLYYNNNELYGDKGPYRASSKQDLADQWTENFDQWSIEAFDRYCYDNPDEIDKMTKSQFDKFEKEFREQKIDEMRREFISGLESLGKVTSIGTQYIESIKFKHRKDVYQATVLGQCSTLNIKVNGDTVVFENLPYSRELTPEYVLWFIEKTAKNR